MQHLSRLASCTVVIVKSAALDQAGAVLGPFVAIELVAVPLLLRLRGRGR